MKLFNLQEFHLFPIMKGISSSTYDNNIFVNFNALSFFYNPTLNPTICDVIFKVLFLQLNIFLRI